MINIVTVAHRLSKRILTGCEFRLTVLAPACIIPVGECVKANSMNAEKSARALIFDLGNVILNFDHMVAVKRACADSGCTPEQAYTAVFASGLEKAYDEGCVTSQEFHRQVARRLNWDVSFERFREIWCDIFEVNEPVAALLHEVKGRHRRLLLSNTNEMHFAYCMERFPVLQLLDELVLSYELGFRKPDPRIFREAVRRSGLPAGDCVYVDDVADFVEVARAEGMRAAQYTSAEQLRADLIEFGILPPAGRSPTAGEGP